MGREMKKKILKRVKDRIFYRFSPIAKIRRVLKRAIKKEYTETIENERKGIKYEIKKIESKITGKVEYDLFLPVPSWLYHYNTGVVLNIRDYILFPFLKSMGYASTEQRSGWCFKEERGIETLCCVSLENIMECNIRARRVVDSYIENKKEVERGLKAFDYEYPESREEGKSLAEKLDLKYK